MKINWRLLKKNFHLGPNPGQSNQNIYRWRVSSTPFISPQVILMVSTLRSPMKNPFSFEQGCTEVLRLLQKVKMSISKYSISCCLRKSGETQQENVPFFEHSLKHVTSCHAFVIILGKLYFLYVCVCSDAQSCLTPCDPIDWSPSSSSVHGIFLARILEWFAISSSVFPLYMWANQGSE